MLKYALALTVLLISMPSAVNGEVVIGSDITISENHAGGTYVSVHGLVKGDSFKVIDMMDRLKLRKPSVPVLLVLRDVTSCDMDDAVRIHNYVKANNVWVHVHQASTVGGWASIIWLASTHRSLGQLSVVRWSMCGKREHKLRYIGYLASADNTCSEATWYNELATLLYNTNDDDNSFFYVMRPYQEKGIEITKLPFGKRFFNTYPSSTVIISSPSI